MKTNITKKIMIVAITLLTILSVTSCKKDKNSVSGTTWKVTDTWTTNINYTGTFENILKFESDKTITADGENIATWHWAQTDNSITLTIIDIDGTTTTASGTVNGSSMSGSLSSDAGDKGTFIGTKQ